MAYLTPAPDAPAATGTGVIVHVPAVDPVVAEHRRHFDGADSLGIPAHVTVLGPFVHPQEVDDRLVTELAAAIGTVAAFDCAFATTRWFAQEVLWLAPEPSEPFRQLTAAVWEAFPRYPPYAGAFDDVVPHLTVGEVRLGSRAALEGAEEAVRSQLPVSARVDRALLIAGSEAPLSWRVLHSFPLAEREPGMSG